MTEEFSKAFARAQAIQRRFDPDYMNSFKVEVKYDSYYEEYMEIEVRTDNDKFFFTTYQCIYEDDYDVRLNELEKTINNILKNNEDD